LHKSAGQIVEFQDLAAAGGIKAEVVLVAASADEDPKVAGGKVVLLPFIGCFEAGGDWQAQW